MRQPAANFGIPWPRYRLVGVAELAAAGVVIGLWWHPLGVAAAAGMALLLLGALITHRRAEDGGEGDRTGPARPRVPGHRPHHLGVTRPAASRPGQPPGSPGQPVDRHSLIQPRGAGDRLPAGPRRHRARDRHQCAGRHQRPSSPRWVSSTPGTATAVSPCRTSSPTTPARDGSCSVPQAGPPTWSTCGWSAARCERGTVAATAAGAVTAAPGSRGGLAGQLPRPTR